MKLQIKKILSIFTVVSILITSNSLVFAYNDYYSNDYGSNKKIKKLQKLNNSLNELINSDIKKWIIKIKNTQDKKLFNQEFAVIKQNWNQILNGLENAYDYSFTEYLSKIKTQAKTYKSLKRDIDNYVKTWVNVYNVSADVSIIEKELVTMQSYYVSIIKDALDKLISSDWIKQSWNEIFEINSNIAKIKINTEKYSNIFSFITGSQEIDYKVKIDFDIFKDEKLNIEYDIKWSFSFDLNIKVIDKDFYLNIKDYSVDFGNSKEDGILEAKKTIETFLTVFKWKTIHIPANYNSSEFKFNYAEQIKKFKEILTVIENNALLTPYKKVTNGFLLTPNTSTMQKIGNIVENEYTSNDTLNARVSLMRTPILYSNINWTSKISLVIKEWDESGNFSIEKKWEDYWITIDFKSKYSTFYTYLQKDLYKLSFKSDEVSVVWNLENKNLNFNIDAPWFKLDLKWATDKDNTDIKISINNTEAGYLKVSRDKDENVSYSFYLKLLDINKLIPTNPEELAGKFVEIKIDGKYLMETWKFEIKKPDSFIELDDVKDLIKTKADSL